MRRRRRLVCPPSSEEEGCSGERVEAEHASCDLGETVEALAHVAGLERDVDFEVAIEGKHNGRSSEGFEEFGEKSDLVA